MAMNTVMRHIRQYLNVHILITWKRSQEDLLNSFAQKVVVQGDCKSDSPGHSALFGTYSLLESTPGKVIESQLVQVYYAYSYISELEIKGLKISFIN